MHINLSMRLVYWTIFKYRVVRRPVLNRTIQYHGYFVLWKHHGNNSRIWVWIVEVDLSCPWLSIAFELKIAPNISRNGCIIRPTIVLSLFGSHELHHFKIVWYSRIWVWIVEIDLSCVLDFNANFTSLKPRCVSIILFWSGGVHNLSKLFLMLITTHHIELITTSWCHVQLL